MGVLKDFPEQGNASRRRGAAWFRSTALLACVAIFIATGQVPGWAETPFSQYDVEAAFIVNFTRFVEWPAETFAGPETPFTICILGEDPFGPTIDQAAEGETVQNRRLVVRRIKEPPRDRACQILFWDHIGPGGPAALKNFGAGTLTVSEDADFVDRGGMIQFVIESRRVHFDINARAASTEKLKLSSQLLKVARSIR